MTEFDPLHLFVTVCVIGALGVVCGCFCFYTLARFYSGLFSKMMTELRAAQAHIMALSDKPAAHYVSQVRAQEDLVRAQQEPKEESEPGYAQ